MKAVLFAFSSLVAIASAQKFFFSDAPTTAPPSFPVPVPVSNTFFAPTPIQFTGPTVNAKYIPIIEHTQIKNSDGSYNLQYKTANGIAQQENSQVSLNAKGEPVLYKSGSYGYTAPDGTPVSISYIADANGFRVSGSPLPVAPQPLPVVPSF